MIIAVSCRRTGKHYTSTWMDTAGCFSNSSSKFYLKHWGSTDCFFSALWFSCNGKIPLGDKKRKKGAGENWGWGKKGKKKKNKEKGGKEKNGGEKGGWKKTKMVKRKKGQEELAPTSQNDALSILLTCILRALFVRILFCFVCLPDGLLCSWHCSWQCCEQRSPHFLWKKPLSDGECSDLTGP